MLGRPHRYLCDVYDKTHKFLPPLGDPKRYAVLQWVHAAEATYALHALAILYTRSFQSGGDVAKTEEALKGNVQKDLDYLESELEKSSGLFLLGDNVTAADTMMEFCCDFVFVRELGTKGKNWPKIEQYVKDCQSTESWKKAQRKTGHKL